MKMSAQPTPLGLDNARYALPLARRPFMTGQTNAAAYTGTIKISQRIPYHTRRGRPRNLPVLLESWKRSGRRYGIKMAFNPGMIHVSPANRIPKNVVLARDTPK